MRQATTVYLAIKTITYKSIEGTAPTNSHIQTLALTKSKLLQLIQAAIEDIRVPTIRITITILPNGLEWPPSRDRARRTRIARQHQRTKLVKRLAVPRAGAPPIRRTVDHRIHPRLAVVRRDEALDPGHHRRGRQAVAGCARRVVLDVQHAGERDAVLGPAAAVREEVRRLRGAGARVGVCEVVAAADEACFGGAGVLRGEGGGDVAGAFGGLGGGG